LAVDLSDVSSVTSNVTPSVRDSGSTAGTLTQAGPNVSGTKITIHGHVPNGGGTDKEPREEVLLVIYPQTHSVASEWLDGLLMLHSQLPITAETSKLVNTVTNYGLKIRLLNVRYTDDYSGTSPTLPSRDGVDDDFYYSVFPW